MSKPFLDQVRNITRHHTKVGVGTDRQTHYISKKGATFIDSNGEEQPDRRKTLKNVKQTMISRVGDTEFEISLSEEQGQKIFEQGVEIHKSTNNKLKSETAMNYASTFFFIASTVLMVVGVSQGMKHAPYRD